MKTHLKHADKLFWLRLASLPLERHAPLVAGFLDDGELRESDCIKFLSKPEVMQASKRADAEEKRHFIIRRWFQRQFVSKILGFETPLPELRLVHELDARPKCLDAPDLNLSFSTSGPMMVACASKFGTVGIDIERKRVVENAAQLAERFFSSDEAAHIAALPSAQQSEHFLFHWTAKEAALKAVGKGIDSGINLFQLRPLGHSSGYTIVELGESLVAWSLQFVEILPNYLIAVVNRKNNTTLS